MSLFDKAWHVLEEAELQRRVERMLSMAPPRQRQAGSSTRNRSDRYASIMKAAQNLADWGAETEEACQKATEALRTAQEELMRTAAAAPAQAKEQRVAAARAAADTTNPLVGNPALKERRRGPKEQVRKVGKDPGAPGGKGRSKRTPGGRGDAPTAE